MTTTDTTSTALLPSCPQWCTSRHAHGWEFSRGEGFEGTFHERASTECSDVYISCEETLEVASGQRSYSTPRVFLVQDAGAVDGLTPAGARALARALLAAATTVEDLS